MCETRKFRTGQWCGYVATFTKGKDMTKIQITDWGGNNPRVIGVCRNNELTCALDCMRTLNKLLNAHFRWEVI